MGPDATLEAGQASTAKSTRERNALGGSEPLYVQIAQVLKEEVVDGTYPVGSLLPTEGALCKRFGVSRYTVREALKLLREDGLVSSRQGAGTVVIPPRFSGTDVHQVMSINDLLTWATSTRFVIDTVRTVTIDDKLAHRTGLSRGEEWLEVRGFRHASAQDGGPECWTEYYINRAYAAVARLLQRQSGPIFPLIEDLFGESIVEVHQQISATLLSATLAAELSVKEASAALEVRRTYKTSDGKVAQVTINTHPASRFEHSMTMRRVKS